MLEEFTYDFGAVQMSIVRLGMAENKNYGDGYDAIFAKKSSAAKKPAMAAKKPTAKKAPAKKPAKKK
jgi:site-specific recombinase